MPTALLRLNPKDVYVSITINAMRFEKGARLRNSLASSDAAKRDRPAGCLFELSRASIRTGSLTGRNCLSGLIWTETSSISPRAGRTTSSYRSAGYPDVAADRDSLRGDWTIRQCKLIELWLGLFNRSTHAVRFDVTDQVHQELKGRFLFLLCGHGCDLSCYLEILSSSCL